ncbi:AsnC family transcriptional regulator [Sporocytophaga myxococcoides]|uniref:AsnC family transcriptional regulator n=1 Tax=Sporocytophaga myxococcoides TaxID=153721 RepID=A0A098LA80_9BACT|nr:Lrp/AsnC family transcriptional regulator [Sporocytophaga myxococcoides]GAL83795.1 AsnC family transcriptional regulator [Sporocytophaga myxococcoides]
MQNISKLDPIDRQILEKLQANAKITNSQLAQEIGLSPAPTLERVRKLENAGLIKSYHAQVDTEKLGLGVGIFILISLSSHKKNQIKSFVEKINNIPEVIECHHITGSGDFLLKVLTHNISSYQELILEKLVDIEEIGNMQSMVILSTYKDSKVMPIL